MTVGRGAVEDVEACYALEQERLLVDGCYEGW